MFKLTPNQIEVLEMLRGQGCHWIAGATEREWKEGREYYIDTRVNVRGIRRKFAKGNREAVEQRLEKESHDARKTHRDG